MATHAEIIKGRRDVFAVVLRFLPDPDSGAGASREASLSWGSLEIWVDGRNTCAHLDHGEAVPEVRWYLLPFLQWLTLNWDFLLHEERLPCRNAAGDAWSSMQKTIEPPGNLEDSAADAWDFDWQSWWSRHCLLACREGGLFPCIYMRRWRDEVEVSWGSRPIAGAPPEFRFDAGHGVGRIDVDFVSKVLYETLRDAAEHLAGRMIDSDVLRRLRKDVEAIAAPGSGRRQALISGLERSVEGWERLASRFDEGLGDAARDELFRTEETPLVVSRASPVALMFGSLAPTLSETDVVALGASLARRVDAGGESPLLASLVRGVPIPGVGDEPWADGYELADELHRNLDDRFVGGEFVDVDAVFRALGIEVDEIRLEDAGVRAVAAAGPSIPAVVLMNSASRHSRNEARRFTLAHELCHLLFDRPHGAPLAIASGPWAPLAVERRANAFAAMFLMPRPMISAAVRRLDAPITEPQQVGALSSQLRTSYTATVEHLCNLNFIDETTRDVLRL